MVVKDQIMQLKLLSFQFMAVVVVILQCQMAFGVIEERGKCGLEYHRMVNVRLELIVIVSTKQSLVFWLSFYHKCCLHKKSCLKKLSC